MPQVANGWRFAAGSLRRQPGCLRGGYFCRRSLNHFRYCYLFSCRFNGYDRRRLQSLDGRRQFDRRRENGLIDDLGQLQQPWTWGKQIPRPIHVPDKTTHGWLPAVLRLFP